MADTEKKVVVEEEAKKAPAKKAAPKKTTAKKAPAKEEAPVAEEKVAPKAKKAPAKKAPAKKEAPKAKKEEKKPAKPVVTEAKASARSVKVTPRKARLVIDLVRGKDVEEALEILAFLNKIGASDVAKLIKSAAANATNNFGMDEDKLYVASIWANDSIKMRRYLPRAKGSASGLVKRFSNLYVVVKERN